MAAALDAVDTQGPVRSDDEVVREPVGEPPPPSPAPSVISVAASTVEGMDEPIPAPPSRPLLRLPDMLSAVRATRVQDIPLLAASLTRQYHIESGEQVLDLLLLGMHVSRMGVMRQLREDTALMRLRGFTDSDIVDYALRFLDAITGEPVGAAV